MTLERGLLFQVLEPGHDSLASEVYHTHALSRPIYQVGSARPRVRSTASPS